MLQITHHNAG